MREPLGIADDDTFFADCPIPAQVFLYRGKVTRVKDGDTCIMWVDMGGGILLATPVRYEHVNCPEYSSAKKEEGGWAATQFNKNLVEGKWATIQTRGRRDQNGRLLGSLFAYQGVGLPLVDVTKAIIEGGHGTKR